MNLTDDDRLIVDLGMHRGDDTDFYLRKGFKVLAVEAAPHLVAAATERFAPAIEAGDLTIVSSAVADYEGEIEFHLSDQDLWGSTRPDMADRGFGVSHQSITVPCTTLDKLLTPYPTPYFIKIDVEGRDLDCLAALGNLPQKPRFVSFEADLTEPAVTESMVSMLAGYGYDRFKLVNQATHDRVEMPNPPREGRYVDIKFTKHMSGLFGEESQGQWLDRELVLERYRRTVRQQAARIEYSSKGTVLGIPLKRIHRPVMWLYNSRPVTWTRERYAASRGVEMGGWFDVHAALS